MAVRRSTRETAVEIAVHITGTHPDGSWRGAPDETPAGRTAEVAALIEGALEDVYERAVSARSLRARLAAGIESICSQGRRLAAWVR